MKKDSDKRPERRPLSDWEREKLRERQREEAKAQAEAIAQAEAKLKQRISEISDNTADAAISALSKPDKEKLGRFTVAHLKQLGYPAKTPTESRIYQNTQRKVIKQLMASDTSIGDIIEGE